MDDEGSLYPLGETFGWSTHDWRGLIAEDMLLRKICFDPRRNVLVVDLSDPEEGRPDVWRVEFSGISDLDITCLNAWSSRATPGRIKATLVDGLQYALFGDELVVHVQAAGAHVSELQENEEVAGDASIERIPVFAGEGEQLSIENWENNLTNIWDCSLRSVDFDLQTRRLDIHVTETEGNRPTARISDICLTLGSVSSFAIASRKIEESNVGGYFDNGYVDGLNCYLFHPALFISATRTTSPAANI